MSEESTDIYYIDHKTGCISSEVGKFYLNSDTGCIQQIEEKEESLKSINIKPYHVEKIRKKLNSIGKRCFVRYFELFENNNLSNEYIEEIIKLENEYKEKATKLRVSNARSIINKGFNVLALEIIISSNRIKEKYPATITKAYLILSEYEYSLYKKNIKD